MRVNNGVNIGPHLVYQKMHGNLAGRLALTANPLSFHIDDDHVFRLDEALIGNRRRAHDVTVGQTGTDVTVRRSNVVLLIDQMAKSGNFGAEVVLKHGRHSITSHAEFFTGLAAEAVSTTRSGV